MSFIFNGAHNSSQHGGKLQHEFLLEIKKKSSYFSPLDCSLVPDKKFNKAIVQSLKQAFQKLQPTS